MRFLPPLIIEKIDIDDLIDALPGIIEAARVAQAEAAVAAEEAENKVAEALEAGVELAKEKLAEEDAQAAAEGDETE